LEECDVVKYSIAVCLLLVVGCVPERGKLWIPQETLTRTPNGRIIGVLVNDTNKPKTNVRIMVRSGKYFETVVVDFVGSDDSATFITEGAYYGDVSAEVY
jgi:hypothetical protein